MVSLFSLMSRFTAPASTHPTCTKSYPVRPSLINRIFIPRGHVAGTLLPLYIDIHGGGFCILTPQFDDEFCSTFANMHNVLVVSINYRKGPLTKFPLPTHDCAAIAAAVIDDETLPIDKNRIVMGGFSAGGNLSLSALQLPILKGKIKGVVPWYPVTDWTIPTAVKLSRRPYEFEGDLDGLRDSAKLFNYGYVAQGQDLRDPLLSVCFAKKEDLPKWIYMIAAEYDMLGIEAQDMMLKFADIEYPTEEQKMEFEKGTYKWTLARGVKHGFTHNTREGEQYNEFRQVVSNELYKRVGEWLFRGPFAKTDAPEQMV